MKAHNILFFIGLPFFIASGFAGDLLMVGVAWGLAISGVCIEIAAIVKYNE
jgi:hypothetical protein